MEKELLRMRILLKKDKSTNTNLVKKQRRISLAGRVCSQKVESVVVIAEGCEAGIPGQEFGRSILVVGVGKVKVRVSLETCMVEVEKHCVILEN